MPEMLIDFLEKNESSVDRFFESLRYPFDRSLKSYKHIMLKYKGSEGLPFYEELAADIRTMAKCAVSLGRKLKEDSKQKVGQVSSESALSDEPSA
jgi:hypothetical protein